MYIGLLYWEKYKYCTLKMVLLRCTHCIERARIPFKTNENLCRILYLLFLNFQILMLLVSFPSELSVKTCFIIYKCICYLCRYKNLVGMSLLHLDMFLVLRQMRFLPNSVLLKVQLTYLLTQY